MDKRVKDIQHRLTKGYYKYYGSPSTKRRNMDEVVVEADIGQKDIKYLLDLVKPLEIEHTSEQFNNNKNKIGVN